MKIYKHNNKLILYLPIEISKKLGLKEDDELDYFEYNNKSFLIAKKADIVSMLTGATESKSERASREIPPQRQAQYGASAGHPLSREELSVLKKLDTLRYPERTVENVSNILDKDEKAVLQDMLKRNVIALFKKGSASVYSIPKSIYDNFLMRKKATQAMPGGRKEQAPPVRPAETPARSRADRPIYNPNNAPEISELEDRGYIVLQTEAEAARVSLMLEDSIRHGQVLGTRSFSNKKFFIVTRQFLDRHIPSIFKMLREGARRTSEIAANENIDADAARAILYTLAENGDITEKKKDIFAIA